LTYKTLDESSGVQINDTISDITHHQEKNMKTISGSLVVNGIFVFEAIVVLVNIKLLIQTYTHTIGSIIIQLGCIGVFYLSFFLLNLWDKSGIYRLMPVLFSFTNQFVLLFFFITGYILIEYGMNILDIEVQNVKDASLYLEKKEKFEQMMNERQNRRKRITRYNHKGFAFSGSAGNDKIVTDKIFSRLQEAIRLKVGSQMMFNTNYHDLKDRQNTHKGSFAKAL